MCCTPLLARWFISHLPQSVLKNEKGLRWQQRLMTVVPQNLPSHIPQDLSRLISKLLKISQRVAQSKHPPKPVKTRILVLSRNLRFSMAQSSLIGLYIFSSTYMSSFKTHNASFHSQKLYLLHSQLQGQNGHFTVKGQNFWSTSQFESIIII